MSRTQAIKVRPLFWVQVNAWDAKTPRFPWRDLTWDDPTAEAMVQARPWAIPLRLELSKLLWGAMPRSSLFGGVTGMMCKAAGQ